MPEDQLLEEAIQLLNTTSKTVKSTEITQLDRMKVAVCGEPKTGKSYLIANTARKPLLHYDFDDRKESIAGSLATTIKTLVDKDDSTPTAWNILESDIGSLEYLKEQQKLPYKSIAIDSISFLRKYAEHQMLRDSSGVKRATQKIGVVQYLIPRGYDAITSVQKMLEGMFNRLFALDIDVYAVFHTRPEKDIQKSTEDNTVYKDMLTVDPPNLKMLLPKFNDTWRCFHDGYNYRVQLKPDFQFNASTVLKNVEGVEDADIQRMLEKHNAQR